jgi:hypothetical protein
MSTVLKNAARNLSGSTDLGDQNLVNDLFGDFKNINLLSRILFMECGSKTKIDSKNKARQNCFYGCASVQSINEVSTATGPTNLVASSLSLQASFSGRIIS